MGVLCAIAVLASASASPVAVKSAGCAQDDANFQDDFGDACTEWSGECNPSAAINSCEGVEHGPDGSVCEIGGYGPDADGTFFSAVFMDNIRAHCQASCGEDDAKFTDVLGSDCSGWVGECNPSAAITSCEGAAAGPDGEACEVGGYGPDADGYYFSATFMDNVRAHCTQSCCNAGSRSLHTTFEFGTLMRDTGKEEPPCEPGTLDECGVDCGGGIPYGKCDCQGHVEDACGVCAGVVQPHMIGDHGERSSCLHTHECVLGTYCARSHTYYLKGNGGTPGTITNTPDQVFDLAVRVEKYPNPDDGIPNEDDEPEGSTARRLLFTGSGNLRSGSGSGTRTGPWTTPRGGHYPNGNPAQGGNYGVCVCQVSGFGGHWANGAGSPNIAASNIAAASSIYPSDKKDGVAVRL